MKVALVGSSLCFEMARELASKGIEVEVVSKIPTEVSINESPVSKFKPQHEYNRVPPRKLSK